MSRILLLEDDPVLGQSLKLSLELDGYVVAWARDLRSALATPDLARTDLFLLDWNLPDGTGLEFCRKIRSKEIASPVIFLTAKIDEAAAVQALVAGANDYVRKPFGQAELFARIKRALGVSLLEDKQLRCGSLVAHLKSRRVEHDRAEIALNRKEFDILVHLLKNSDAVVSREDLLAVIDPENKLEDRTVDSHLSHLRGKLRKAGADTVQIESVYGVGYRLSRAGRSGS